MKLSIIIVGWNTRHYLEGCLESLYKNSPSCEFEVIFVDNGSEDGSVEFVRNLYPSVVIIENDDNLGFQKANNQALRIALGQYIILLNSDTVILPGTFDKMLTFMEARPEVGAASPKCLKPDGSIEWAISQRPTINVLLAWLFRRHLYLYWLLKFQKRRSPGVSVTQEQDYAYGAFFVLRKEVLTSVGLMDENLFLSGDDVGWSIRIANKGWKIFYVANVSVIHYGAGSRNDRPIQRQIDWLMSHRYLLRHYKDKVYCTVADCIFLADIGLNLIESFLRRLMGKSKDAVFSSPWIAWNIFRMVYLRRSFD